MGAFFGKGRTFGRSVKGRISSALRFAEKGKMPNTTAASGPTFRRRVYEVLEVAHPGDRLSAVADFGLMALIATNVVAVVLESVAGLYQHYGTLFDRFELVSLVIFSIEYGLRLWSAAERPGEPDKGENARRFAYALSLRSVIDLIAIAPFLFAFTSLTDLRVLRVVRLLRIFKFTRYSGAMKNLLEVLWLDRRSYGAVLFIMATVLVFASSGIYLVEHRAQPDAFGSIPAAMWWAVATLTTVGYGDVTPVTAAGKVFAAVITIAGVGLVALPSGLLASGFLGAQQRSHETLRRQAARALADDRIDEAEERSYLALAERLGVDPEIAQKIIGAALLERNERFSSDDCPHCGKTLG